MLRNDLIDSALDHAAENALWNIAVIIWVSQLIVSIYGMMQICGILLTDIDNEDFASSLLADSNQDG